MISDSDPNFVTDPQLSDILAELASREPIFHRPELGTTRADFERMTVDDFWEVGASGRRYSKAAALDVLEERYAVPHADAWETAGFHCRKLGAGFYLVTYTLIQNGVRRTRRSTIWHRSPQGWQIVYHQGTIIQDPE